MSYKYPTRLLSDLAKIYSGYAFKSSDLADDLGIPVIKIANIQGRYVSKNCISYLPENIFNKKLHNYILNQHDILVAMTGAGSVGRIGKMRKMNSVYLVNQRVAIVRIESKIANPEYVYQVISNASFERILYDIAYGAGQPNLSPNDIGSLKIPFPSLSDQNKIAAILSAYDDLIENNTRRIKILEEMAQALYREWFVHFRFPGHEKVRMVESPLGRIPEGWEAATLDKVIRFQNGRAVEVDDQGKFPLYGSNGVIGKTIDSRYHNGIVIGRVGAYCGSTFYCKSEFCASDNTIVAQAISEDLLCTELIYYILKNIDLGRNASGSAQPLLTQNVLKKIPVLIPDNIANKIFKNFLKPVNDEIINLYDGINNLQLIRDCLLPKLITGEIDVSDLDIETLNGAYYG